MKPQNVCGSWKSPGSQCDAVMKSHISHCLQIVTAFSQLLLPKFNSVLAHKLSCSLWYVKNLIYMLLKIHLWTSGKLTASTVINFINILSTCKDSLILVIPSNTSAILVYVFKKNCVNSFRIH